MAAKKTKKETSPPKPAKAAPKRPAAKKVATPAKPAPPPRQRADVDDPPKSAAPTQEEIARAAYLRWQSRGGGDGQDHDDWLEAERRLHESWRGG
jgi:hypothetical protein